METLLIVFIIRIYFNMYPLKRTVVSHILTDLYNTHDTSLLMFVKVKCRSQEKSLGLHHKLRAVQP